MDRLLEVASRITTPLSLAGLAVIVLLVIFRALISKNIFSVLDKRGTLVLLNRLMLYVFIVTLVTVVLSLVPSILTIVNRSTSGSVGLSITPYPEETQDFAYDYDEIDGKLHIRPTSTFLKRLTMGEPVYTVGRLERSWHPPKLAAKAVNNTQQTVFLTEALIEVKSVRLLKEALPRIDRDSYAVLIISDSERNIMKEVTLDFYIRNEECQTVHSGEYTGTINIGDIDSLARVSMKEYIPEAIKNEKWVCILGRLNYKNESGDKRIAIFDIAVPVDNWNPSLPSPPPPRYSYNLKLELKDVPYKKRLPIAQEIKPGDTDYFLLEIGADRWAEFDFTITFRGAGGTELPSTDVALEVFMPWPARLISRQAKETPLTGSAVPPEPPRSDRRRD